MIKLKKDESHEDHIKLDLIPHYLISRVKENPFDPIEQPIRSHNLVVFEASPVEISKILITHQFLQQYPLNVPQRLPILLSHVKSWQHPFLPVRYYIPLFSLWRNEKDLQGEDALPA